MKIEIKDNTGQHSLMLSEIPDKLYITDKLWVSTSYNQVKVGLDHGPVYRLQGGALVEILQAPDPTERGCHQ